MTLDDKLTLFRIAGTLEGIGRFLENEKASDLLSNTADCLLALADRQIIHYEIPAGSGVSQKDVEL